MIPKALPYIANFEKLGFGMLCIGDCILKWAKASGQCDFIKFRKKNI